MFPRIPTVIFAFLLVITVSVRHVQGFAFPVRIQEGASLTTTNPRRTREYTRPSEAALYDLSSRPRSQRSSFQLSALPTATTASSPAWFYLCALAIQFGIQPILTKSFIPKNIIRSTIILAQDCVRFTASAMLLFLSGAGPSTIKSWTLEGALLGAGIPAGLYLIQNYCTLIAYQNLAPVTFNILSQTKTLSAALCCYLLLGRKQSPLQIVALFLLILSALVIERVVPLPIKSRAPKNLETKDETETMPDDRNLVKGVLPVLIASFMSGLAGSISQRHLQTYGYNVYLFSMELSAFSMLTLITSLLLGSPDGKKVRESKINVGWTWKTLLPVFTNAGGGILVGLVTMHAGVVKKGFALIFGLLIAGLLQNFISKESVTAEQLVGGVLVAVSVWMHSNFPPTS